MNTKTVFDYKTYSICSKDGLRKSTLPDLFCYRTLCLEVRFHFIGVVQKRENFVLKKKKKKNPTVKIWP